jgi:fibronectin-binding autotransporter adhesin
MANTQATLQTAPALDAAADWSTLAVPGQGVDAVVGSAYPTASTGLTMNGTTSATEAFGSLDIANSFAVNLSNPSATAVTFTLGNASAGATTNNNSYSGTAADLLYVASGSTFSILNASNFAIALAESGNFDIAGSATVAANISGGSKTLVKTGAGTLTLSGANTFTGGFNLASGTLNINNSAALGTGTFNINGGTIANSTSGGSASPTNLQTWNANFTLAGTTANVYMLGAATMSGSRTVTVTGSYLMGEEGIISDGGSGYTLTKAGSGYLYLTAANTYSGGTTINAGTIDILSISSIPAGTVTLNGGTLEYYNNFSGVAQFSSSKPITIGSSNGTLDTKYAVTTFEILGAISGTGNNLTISGAGTVSLENYLNSYGSTNVSAGSTLRLETQTAAGTGPIYMANTSTLVLSDYYLSSYYPYVLNAINLSSGTVTINTPNTSGTTWESEGLISGAGQLVKTGVGELYLEDSSSTWSGGTDIVAGTLRAGSNGTLGSSSVAAQLTTIESAGTLLLYLYSGGNPILNVNRQFAFNGTGGQINVNSTDSWTIPGLVTNGATSGSLTKIGAGTLTLSNTSNTYSSGTNLFGGILSVNTLANGGVNSSIGNSANNAIYLNFQGGTLQYTGAAASTDHLFTVGASGGMIDASGTGPLTFTNTGVNISTDTPGGSFTLGNTSSTVTYTAGTDPNVAIGETVSGANISAGTTITAINYGTNSFTISSASTSTASTSNALTFGLAGRTLMLTGSNTAVNTIAGILSDSSAPLTVAKSGAGFWSLTGTNTYSGGTIAAGGILSVSLLANGGVPSNIGLSSNAATGILLQGGTLQYTGPTVSTDHLFTIGAAGGSLDASGTGPVTFTNTGANVSTDSPSGTYTLANSSTSVAYTPTTAPNLAVGETVSGPNISAGTTITAVNYNTATFTLSSAVTATATTTNTLTFGVVGRTLTLTGTNTGNNLIAGVLADSAGGGPLSLSKTGAGTWVLAGSNSYSGSTNISVGTLVAGAADTLSPNSVVNVTGGILDVSAYNNSIASLTVGAGGTLNVGAGSILTVTGAASFGGTLNLIGIPASLPDILMTYASETGTFASTLPAGEMLSYTANALEVVSTSAGPSFLTWNNAGGTGDGMTWDTVMQNWNNGTGVVAYSDTSNGSSGDNVSFTDGTSSSYNVTISGVLHPTSVTFTNSVNNYNLSGANSSSGIAGPGSLTLTGTGTVTLYTNDSYTGGTNVSAGKLVLASSNAFPANTSLTIASGAFVTIANHSTNATYVPIASSLTNSGTIDITNNAMIVHNGSIGTISAQVAAAYSNGTWTGNSAGGVITRSAAASDLSHLTAVGVATGLTSFEGQTVSPSDVLVKYTYYGDADLSGTVDGSDYSRIDNGALLNLTGWYNGDFNYDGVINGSDYTLIDNSYNTQGANIAAEIGGAIATAQIAGGSGVAAVPEPTMLGLLGLGAIGLLGRRKRC